MPREYINDSGLRIDGRRPGELRKVTCKMGILSKADGSAYIEHGNTKAIAAVFGPREVSLRSEAEHDRAIIRCEYGSAHFSGQTRLRRTKGDRRSLEVARVIQQTFEAVIQTALFPRTQIDIFVQVLQNDGGQLAACINAATLALIDAGVPMKDFVCAIHAGYLTKTPVLGMMDSPIFRYHPHIIRHLNHHERGAQGPDLPLAILPRSNKICMMQMDARVKADIFESVVQLAMKGCSDVRTTGNFNFS